MSALFDQETVEELKRIFASLRRSIRDVLIVDSLEKPGTVLHCHSCPEAIQLAKELSRVSEGKLTFEILDAAAGRRYRPRYYPAFIYGTKTGNVRYYGLPYGQEFAPFIYVHEYLSEGIKLPKRVVEEVESIDVPLHIKVFVTPECPYCPLVVDFLNQVGIVNSNFIVETIEAFEHPLEADKYGVMYVPYIAITRVEDYEVYGAKPIAVIPGYAPNEEILEVIKKASRKVAGRS